MTKWKAPTLSKPISFKVTDDLKIFAASQCKLNRIMNIVKTTMDDVMCGVHVSDNSGMISDETARLPSLEDGKQYKFPGALRVLCRRKNWSWSAQRRSTSDGCLSFGQVLYPTTIL